AVEHQAVAVGQSELGRQPRRHQVQVADQLAVVLGQLVVGGDHLARDDQHVNGSLRVDVVEGDAAVVLVDDLCRDLLLDDFQEDVVGHHGGRLPRVVSIGSRTYHITKLSATSYQPSAKRIDAKLRAES